MGSFTIEPNRAPKIHQHIHTISKVKRLSNDDRLKGCRLGTDSHSDHSCVGRHARILSVLEGQSCTVRPFNDSYALLTNVKTVNAAFASETKDGETVILIINQALDFRH